MHGIKGTSRVHRIGRTRDMCRCYLDVTVPVGCKGKDVGPGLHLKTMLQTSLQICKYL
ncbi:hypothetical protein ACSAZK_15965 [Methanosarcina sp. Mfa9]|uniref:hypothetical protein n=1 Tax=Methanosarcina sp. Mfa9 TaxID=3439063 RepID=UPI003F84A9E2